MTEYEEPYRFLFDELLSGVAYCQVLADGPPPHDFVYLEVNRAFGTLTGLRDVAGKRASEVRPGLRETDAELLSLYSEVAATGIARRFDHPVNMLDSWCSVSVYSPKKGRFVAVFEVVTDKRVAQALRESEARLAAVLEGSNDGYLDLDLVSGTSFRSRKCWELVGWTPEELPADSPEWLAKFHPDDAPARLAAVAALAEGTQARIDVTYRMQSRSGAWKWLRKRLKAVAHDAAGRPTRLAGTVSDVDELHRGHERALQAERLHGLSERINEAELVTDPSGIIVEANERACELYGRTRDELLGLKVHALRSADSQPDIETLVRKAASEALRFETQHTRQDGTSFPVEVSTRLFMVGGVKYLHRLVRDLTEQRRREAELSLLAGIAKNMRDAVVVTDLDARMLRYANDAERVLGWTEAEVVGRNPEECFAADYPDGDREVHLARVKALLPSRIHARLLRKDGVRIDAEVTVGPRLDGSGKPVGYFSVIRDITERVQAREALLSERQRYESLVRIARDGIHVLDEHGNLVEANEAFLRMIGQPPEAVGRLHIRDWDVQFTEAEIEPAVRAVIDHPSLFRTRHRHADGSLFDVEIHAGRVDLEGRKYSLAIARDISARVELERQLEALNHSLKDQVDQAVAELRAKDQQLILQNRQAALGEMLDYIAHQWRQPLNVLGLLLFTLRSLSRRGELDEAAVEDTVVRGSRLVEKMSSTITDFHDFFRPHKDRQVFSVLAKLRETVALVEPSYRHVGIGLEIEAAGDLRLHGVANEYSQVLLNLLANARQAIMAAGVAHGKVTLDLGSRDGLTCLTVRDNGGGIPPAVFEKLFERYFTTRVEGTGLGLYMSRQIVEQSFGGRLEARNVDGGAEFAVLTPLAPGAVSE